MTTGIISLPSNRNSQPKIPKLHPAYAGDMLTFHECRLKTDLVSGRNLSVNGGNNITTRVGYVGVGSNANVSGADISMTSGPFALTGLYNSTTIWLVSVVDNLVGQELIGGSSYESGVSTITLALNRDPYNRITVLIGDGLGNLSDLDLGFSAQIGKTYCIAHSQNNGRHIVAVNGRVLTDVTLGYNGNNNSFFTTLNLGYGYFNSATQLVMYAGRFKRAFTIYELINLTNSPWSIYAKRPEISFFDMGAGGTVSISSAALSVATSTGELSTSLNISGSSASIASIAGTPTLTINLSASALAQSLASGLLSQGMSISGDMSAQSTATGNVSQNVFIEGSATGQSAASGQIGIQLNIAGSSISEAFASGVISGGSVSSISGAASGVSAASGSVGLNIPIAGAASAQSNISGSVGVNIPVSGVSASVSSITGALTIDGLIYIDGSALSNAQSSGLISLTIPLSGAALAVAYASGVAMPDAISADYACLHGTVSRLTMVETSANHLTNLTTRVNYVARC